MEDKLSRPSIRYGSAKMAVDVEINYIIDYLCDMGPRYCPKCPSQCAYGKRYLKEYVSQYPKADISSGREKIL